MTDSNNCYTYPGKEHAAHEKVDHSAEEYVRGDVTTNSVEGYFSLLKRGVHGTFHHISKQHPDKYLGEFDFRFNHRKMDDGPRTDIAIGRTRGKRLTYRQPVAMLSDLK